MNFSSPISNDNSLYRKTYQDAVDLLPYIPKARMLINKYGSAYWKNHNNDLDFVYFEKSLCRYLKMEPRCVHAKQLLVKWLARELEINPLHLYNDRDLAL